ncbi:MAG: hypothetical protein ABIT76_13995 [Chthoniobacterales bacterium]
MQPHEDPADRPLWDLLDRALNPADEVRVPGSFANDVLRRIRLEATMEPVWSFHLWLAQSWKVLVGVTAAVALLVSAIPVQENQTRALAQNAVPEMSQLLASVPAGELADLGDLDTSLDDNELWLGTASY